MTTLTSTISMRPTPHVLVSAKLSITSHTLRAWCRYSQSKSAKNQNGKNLLSKVLYMSVFSKNIEKRRLQSSACWTWSLRKRSRALSSHWRNVHPKKQKDLPRKSLSTYTTKPKQTLWEGTSSTLSVLITTWASVLSCPSWCQDHPNLKNHRNHPTKSYHQWRKPRVANLLWDWAHLAALCINRRWSHLSILGMLHHQKSEFGNPIPNLSQVSTSNLYFHNRLEKPKFYLSKKFKKNFST